MTKVKFTRAMLVALSLSGLAACSVIPRSAPPMRPAAFVPMGVSAPYLNGQLIGGTQARAKKMRAAGITPLGAGMAPAYMAELAGELRRQTAGMGIDVIDLSGRGVLVRIPAALSFGQGSAEVAPQIRGALRELARTLDDRPKAYVDVYAHSDTTGDAKLNMNLSSRRASAVAAVLSANGVKSGRIASQGFGESQPLVVPDDTEAKQGQNRRVEIRLVPFGG